MLSHFLRIGLEQVTKTVSVFTAVLSDDSLSVINFFDDGFSVLQPLKITDTHVIVEVCHLSAFGLIWDFVKRFLTIKNPVKGQVLLFVRATPIGAQTQNLDVFLLPCNVPLHEVKLDQMLYLHCFQYFSGS